MHVVQEHSTDVVDKADRKSKSRKSKSKKSIRRKKKKSAKPTEIIPNDKLDSDIANAKQDGTILDQTQPDDQPCEPCEGHCESIISESNSTENGDIPRIRVLGAEQPDIPDVNFLAAVDKIRELNDICDIGQSPAENKDGTQVTELVEVDIADEQKMPILQEHCRIPQENVDLQDQPERKSKSRKSVKRKKRTKSKKPEIQSVVVNDNVDIQTNLAEVEESPNTNNDVIENQSDQDKDGISQEQAEADVQDINMDTGGAEEEPKKIRKRKSKKPAAISPGEQSTDHTDTNQLAEADSPSLTEHPGEAELVKDEGDLGESQTKEVIEDTRDSVEQTKTQDEQDTDNQTVDVTQNLNCEQITPNVPQETPISHETIHSQDQPERKSKSRKSIKRKKRTKSIKPEIQSVVENDNVDIKINLAELEEIPDTNKALIEAQSDQDKDVLNQDHAGTDVQDINADTSGPETEPKKIKKRKSKKPATVSQDEQNTDYTDAEQQAAAEILVISEQPVEAELNKDQVYLGESQNQDVVEITKDSVEDPEKQDEQDTDNQTVVTENPIGEQTTPDVPQETQVSQDTTDLQDQPKKIKKRKSKKPATISQGEQNIDSTDTEQPALAETLTLSEQAVEAEFAKDQGDLGESQTQVVVEESSDSLEEPKKQDEQDTEQQTVDVSQNAIGEQISADIPQETPISQETIDSQDQPERKSKSRKSKSRKSIKRKKRTKSMKPEIQSVMGNDNVDNKMNLAELEELPDTNTDLIVTQSDQDKDGLSQDHEDADVQEINTETDEAETEPKNIRKRKSKKPSIVLQDEQNTDMDELAASDTLDLSEQPAELSQDHGDLEESQSVEVVEETKDYVEQPKNLDEQDIDQQSNDQIEVEKTPDGQEETPISHVKMDSQDKLDRKSKSRKSMKRKKRTNSIKPEIQPVVENDNVDLDKNLAEVEELQDTNNDLIETHSEQVKKDLNQDNTEFDVPDIIVDTAGAGSEPKKIRKRKSKKPAVISPGEQNTDQTDTDQPAATDSLILGEQPVEAALGNDQCDLEESREQEILKVTDFVGQKNNLDEHDTEHQSLAMANNQQEVPKEIHQDAVLKDEGDLGQMETEIQLIDQSKDQIDLKEHYMSPQVTETASIVPIDLENTTTNLDEQSLCQQDEGNVQSGDVDHETRENMTSLGYGDQEVESKPALDVDDTDIQTVLEQTSSTQDLNATAPDVIDTTLDTVAAQPKQEDDDQVKGWTNHNIGLLRISGETQTTFIISREIIITGFRLK